MDASPIKLISFDLDNTLYDNQPVIQRAEEKSREYLQYEFERQGKKLDYQNLVRHRDLLLDSAQSENPHKYDNLSYLRQCALLKVCDSLGDSSKIARMAFEIFIDHRSRVEIDVSIVEMLERLSRKLTLISITNGNCDVKKLSISNYFNENYSPIQGYNAKPDSEMLLKARDEFNLSSNQILHVGDSHDSDGEAAKNAGCPFYYFSPFSQSESISDACNRLEKHIASII